MSGVGSAVYPKRKQFRRAVRELASNLSAPWLDWEAFHNHYTAYTAALYQFGTGERPGKDLAGMVGHFFTEEGFKLANDKLSNVTHFNRFLVMPPMVQQQIDSYHLHVRGVIQRCLSEGKEEMASYIQSISSALDAPESQRLAWLFFLEEGQLKRFTPKRCYRYLASDWPYPLNVGRHVIETDFWEAGVAPFFIDAQLMHIVGGRHPFGEHGVYSMLVCRDRISGYQEALLTNWGWVPVRGLSPTSGGDFVRLPLPQDWKWTLKLDEKLAQRAAVGESLAAMSEEILQQEKDASLSSAQSNELIEELIVAAGNYSDLSSTEMLRLIETILDSRGDAEMEGLNVDIPLPSEPSPIDFEWPGRYRAAKHSRQRFMVHLSSRAPWAGGQLEEAWAEVTLSACLNGLYNKAWLRELVRLGPNAAVASGDDVIFWDIWEKSSGIDASQNTRPNWRWLPDPLSRGLLLGMAHGFLPVSANGQLPANADPLPNIRADRVEEHLDELLGRVLAVTELDFEAKLDRLCQQSEAYWLIRHPGYIRRILQGVQPVTPLSSSAFLRAVSDDYWPEDHEDRSRDLKACSDRLNALIAGRDAELSEIQPENWPERPRIPQWRREIDSYEKFRKWINHIFASTEVRKDFKINKLFFVQIMEGLGKRTDTFPKNCEYVGRWICKLLIAGGNRYERLKVQTPRDYGLEILGCLEKAGLETDLCDVDGGDLHAFYREAILKRNKIEHRKRLLSLIVSFHDFLAHGYGLEDEINWSELRTLCGQGGDHEANAQILTTAEYSTILEEVDAAYAERPERLYVKGAAILGYRFRLRMGEIVRLEVQDLQIADDDLLVVQVWKTKSYAGARQVPVVCKLDPAEVEVLRTIKVTHLRWGRPLSTKLFSLEDRRLSRFELNELLMPIVRWTVGDPQYCFHQLRHSGISAQVISSLPLPAHGPTTLCVSKNTGWELTATAKEEADSAQCLDIIAQHNGHADCAETLGTYWATPELVVESYSYAYLPEGMSPECFQNITGLSESQLRSRKKRARVKNDHIAGLLLTLRTIPVTRKVIPASVRPPYDFSALSHSEGTSIYDVDNVLRAYALCQRRFEELESLSGVPLNIARKIIEAAEHVEERSGYIHYAVRGGNPFLGAALQPKLEALYRRQKQFRRSVEAGSLDGRLLEGNVYAVWEKSYCPKADTEVLLSESAEERLEIKQMLNQLGIDDAKISIQLPKDITSETRGELEEILASEGHGLGFKCSRYTSSTHADEKTSYIRPMIIYDWNKEDSFPPSFIANRVMFLKDVLRNMPSEAGS